MPTMGKNHGCILVAVKMLFFGKVFSIKAKIGIPKGFFQFSDTICEISSRSFLTDGIPEEPEESAISTYNTRYFEKTNCCAWPFEA